MHGRSIFRIAFAPFSLSLPRTDFPFFPRRCTRSVPTSFSSTREPFPPWYGRREDAAAVLNRFFSFAGYHLVSPLPRAFVYPLLLRTITAPGVPLFPSLLGIDAAKKVPSEAIALRPVFSRQAAVPQPQPLFPLFKCPGV